MDGVYLTMSEKERQRLVVLERIRNKEFSQIAASKQLGLSTRQIKGLWRAYKPDGAEAIISKRRG